MHARHGTGEKPVKSADFYFGHQKMASIFYPVCYVSQARTSGTYSEAMALMRSVGREREGGYSVALRSVAASPMSACLQLPPPKPKPLHSLSDHQMHAVYVVHTRLLYSLPNCRRYNALGAAGKLRLISHLSLSARLLPACK